MERVTTTQQRNRIDERLSSLIRRVAMELEREQETACELELAKDELHEQWDKRGDTVAEIDRMDILRKEYKRHDKICDELLKIENALERIRIITGKSTSVNVDSAIKFIEVLFKGTEFGSYYNLTTDMTSVS